MTRIVILSILFALSAGCAAPGKNYSLLEQEKAILDAQTSGWAKLAYSSAYSSETVNYNVPYGKAVESAVSGSKECFNYTKHTAGDYRLKMVGSKTDFYHEVQTISDDELLLAIKAHNYGLMTNPDVFKIIVRISKVEDNTTEVRYIRARGNASGAQELLDDWVRTGLIKCGNID